ncbi:hypothetical protein JXB11_05115 [Candidatus Woesearchaeota archaeon]|nr:hypothetical protein [Candidatus Woesearchaeota archaeon]
MIDFTSVLLIIAFALVAFLLGKFLTERKISRSRQDAVERSRYSLMGRVWEQVAPFTPEFKYHPADLRFIGAPVDYIVFEGMNEKDIKRVIFLEVKSGKSRLNEQQLRLKEAIKGKKVEWEEFRI